MRIRIDKSINQVCLELFDRKYTKYGGHWQFISALFRHRIDYFGIWVGWHPYFIGYNCTYYDGYIHSFGLGFIGIYWGGFPEIDNVNIGFYPKGKDI